MLKARFLTLYCMLALSLVSWGQGKPVVSILGDSYSTFEGFIPEGNAIWYTATPQERTDVTDVEQT